MSNSIPESVRERVKGLIYDKADEVNYIAQGRIDNGAFMNALVSNPEIGGVLMEYMSEAEIRTYIKDAVLNRYTKEANERARKGYNIGEVISAEFGPCNRIDCKKTVEMYKSSEREDSFCVVGKGMNTKWETALRHAIMYRDSLPEETKRKDVRLAVCCTAPRGKFQYSERAAVKRALDRLGVAYYCIEFQS